MALPLTSVLAVRPYYDFLLESRLAELKGAALSQRRRDERRGPVDDSPEARRRENVRLEAAAAEFAAERTERMLSGAARHLWSVSELQVKVRKATRPERPPSTRARPRRARSRAKSQNPCPRRRLPVCTRSDGGD
jgi:hypothetical protein